MLEARIGIEIATNLSPVVQVERLSSLLTDSNAVDDHKAVTLEELNGAHVRLNGSAEGLGRANRTVHNVVRVRLGVVSACRGFGDSGETVPGHTVATTGEQSTVINASFILALPGSVPGELRHSSSLEE